MTLLKRLSELPLFFTICVLSFLTCGVGFGEVFSSGNSSGNSHFRGHGYGGSTSDSRSLGGTSNSFMRRSSGFFSGQRKSGHLDPLDPFVSRSEGVDYVRIDSPPIQTGRLDRLRSLSPNFGVRRKYRLPSLDSRLDSRRDGGLDYYNDPRVSVRTLPPLEDDLTMRVNRLARRERMLEESIVYDSEVYRKQEKSSSQEINSDVNYTGDSPRDTAVRGEYITDLPAVTEPDQILEPLSPDEVSKDAELIDEKALDEMEADDSLGVDDAAGEDGVDKPKRVNLKSKRSIELLEKARNFENHANGKFNVYVKIADKFLRDGEYYNAKDAYEIAGVWKSDSARAYAGKAYAHLAAGEYMSSATYLMRAMESSDEYAKTKVDVAGMIGNKELYDKRVGEVKVMYEAGGFYKAAFLLGYLSYQEGDFELAKECIDSAGSKLSGTRGWKSLKAAISDKQ